MAEGERGSSAELRRHREMTENTTTNTTTEASTKATNEFESGAGVEDEEDAVEKPADQQNETVMDTTSADEVGSDSTTSVPKNQTETAVTDQVNEQEAIEARTEDSEDTTVEDTTCYLLKLPSLLQVQKTEELLRMKFQLLIQKLQSCRRGPKRLLQWWHPQVQSRLPSLPDLR